MVKTTKEAEKLWEDYKKSDPLMMRKSFSVKDVFYRKSKPGKELWRWELSFDCSFYVIVIAAIATLGAVVWFMHRIKKSFSRLGKRRA